MIKRTLIACTMDVMKRDRKHKEVAEPVRFYASFCLIFPMEICHVKMKRINSPIDL